MRAVIMAGGEGTRLRPFTHTIPKPLLPIGRKPIGQIIVERLRDHGFNDIIMSVGYAADLIRAFFQDGSQFGTKISYFHETEKLGTAGCLARIPQLRESVFLVTNGDILTDLDYRLLLNTHTQSKSLLSVVTRSESVTIPYGVLKLDGDLVLGVEEKPKFAYHFNAGIYACSPDALDLVPPDRASDMTDLINNLQAHKNQVRSHPLAGLWYDLARVTDFEKALEELEAKYPQFIS
jgi:NDP-sugar pyrophosphorylase family protein